jgi:hypothetical protein
MKRIYLGGGAYADFGDYDIRLWTDRGLQGIHEIYLEPYMLESLVLQFNRFCDENRAQNDSA